MNTPIMDSESDLLKLCRELTKELEKCRLERAKCVEMREALKREADNAYVRGCEICKQPECLGEEYKLARGQFGKAELRAHNLAHEFFGFHKLAYQLLNALSSDCGKALLQERDELRALIVDVVQRENYTDPAINILRNYLDSHPK